MTPPRGCWFVEKCEGCRSNLSFVFMIARWSARISVRIRKSVAGVISFLIIESFGPFLSWNSPLMPPTFWVAMVMDGHGGVGLNGGRWWSIAGHRGGRLMRSLFSVKFWLCLLFWNAGLFLFVFCYVTILFYIFGSPLSCGAGFHSLTSPPAVGEVGEGTPPQLCVWINFFSLLGK
jgi:hypothetical protein